MLWNFLMTQLGDHLIRHEPPLHMLMKTKSLIVLLSAVLACPAISHAAGQNWTGGSVANGNWSTVGNWNGAVPGATSGTTNGDTATFNAAIANTWGSTALIPVVIDSATQNIKSIAFDLAAGNYFIGGTGANNSLLLTSGGSISINNTLTATNAIETVNAPLVIEGAGGTFSLTNNSFNGAGAGAGTLNIGGGITGGAAGATVLTLSGSNTNANTVSGNIGTGSATTMAVTKGGAGTWVLTGSNTYSGVTTISGGTLSLGSSGALGGGGNITFAGGTLQFSGSNTTDYSSKIVSSGSAISIDTNSQTVTFGALAASNSGGLAKSGAGTLILNAANAYTGTTTVNAGTLQLSGSVGAIAGTAFPLNGGTFVVNNTTAAGGTNNTRIADAATFSLVGGTFSYLGADAAATNSTESIGAITQGAGYSTVTITAGGSNTAQLTAASFGHSGGTGVTLVNGTSLGSSTTASNRFIITSTPTLAGTTAPTNGINAASKNTKIVPFLVGEATATTGGLGTATGTANTFVTYAATSGLRPLNLTDEFTSNAITSTNNIYLTSATTAASTIGINSLILNGGDLSINDGATLTDASGAILFTGSSSIKPTGTTGNLTLATTTDAQVTVNSGITGTISANIIPNGSNNLTKSGLGTLILSGTNSYTGTTTVAAGTVKIGSSASIPGALTTGATGTFDLNGFDQTLGALALTNAGTVTNSGASKTLTIGNGSTGAGSFTGNTNVIWNNAATNSTLSGAWSNTGNLTLNTNGAGTITLSGTVNNTGTITNSGSGSVTTTISGNIGTNVTSVIQNSPTSTLSLSGNNAIWTGGIQVTSGTVQTGGSSAPSGTGTITLGSNITAGDAMLVWGSSYANPSNPFSVSGGTGSRTIRLTQDGSVTLSGNIALSGDLVVDNAAPTKAFTLNGTITGNNTITFTNTGGGTGWTSIGGNSSAFTGTLQVGSGTGNATTLQATNIGTALTAGNATLNVASNGTFDLKNGVTIGGLTGSGTVSNSGVGKVITLAGASSYTFSGSITQNTLLTKSGTGTQTLSGTSTYTGTTTISGGTLVAGNTAAFGLSTNTLALNAGTLDLATDTSITSYNLTTNNNGGAITILSNKATAATGGITQTLGTFRIYTPPLNIAAGSNVTGGTPSVSIGNVTLTNTGGTITTFNPTTASLSLAKVNMLATNNNNITVTLDGTATGNTVTDIISNVGGGAGTGKVYVTKSNSSIWTLSGANTYTGTTTVTGGTLVFTKQAALYSGTPANWVKTSITVGTGATMAFGVGDSAGGYFDSAALDSLQTNLKTSISTNGFKAGSIMGFDTTNATGATFSYNTAVTDSTGTGSGAVGLAKLGAGSLVLGGTNTYTGGTTIKAGTLALGSSGAVGSSGNITFSGGILQFSSSNTTDYATRIKNSASAVAIDTNGQTVTLGAIDSTNTAGLTKSGGGTLALGTSGSPVTQTYTGPTLVTTGTLVVNGTLQNGGVTVNSGATLKGGITAGGTTSILSGGTLSVGNSPGIGSFATLTLAGTDIMEFNASPSRGAAGSDYDTINVSTALTYGGEMRLTFAGLVASNATPFTLFTGAAGSSSFGSVTIYGSGGSLAGSLTDSSGTWSGLADLGYGGGTQQFTFTQSNGDLIVAVPEPATWALLAFSLTTVMIFRRRRDP